MRLAIEAIFIISVCYAVSLYTHLFLSDLLSVFIYVIVLRSQYRAETFDNVVLAATRRVRDNPDGRASRGVPKF